MKKQIGPYAIEKEIGRGGMGAVMDARAPDGSRVAVKVLLRPPKETDQARFDRERRLQASLGFEKGFVPLIDAGVSPSGPYVVMPFLEGGTLRRRLLDRGSLEVDEVVDLGIAIGEALGHAHREGIVHRDVKPENILFGPDDRPLVADLGLAKHFSEEAPGASQSVALSKTGESRGTLGYMAAEQLENSKTVGPPADVFSLAVMLYEALGGNAPFAGESSQHTVSNVIEGNFAPLRTVRGDVPKAVARVIERGLARKAEDRYEDGAAFAQALLEAAETRARSRLPLVAGLLVVLSGGALAGVLLLPGKTGPRPVAPTPPALVTPPPAPQPGPAPHAPPPPPGPVPQPEAPPRATAALPDIVKSFEATKHAKLESVLGGYAWRERAAVTALVVAPDETFFVTGNERGEIRTFDVETGLSLERLGAHEKACTALAISHDGKRLFSGSENGDVAVWSVAKSAQLSSAHASDGAVRAAAFLTKDRALSLHEDGTLRFWNLATGAKPLELKVGENPTALSLSPDGSLAFVTTEDGTYVRVDVEAVKVTKRVKVNQTHPVSVSFGQGGRWALTGGMGGKVFLWDTASMTIESRGEAHAGAVSDVRFFERRQSVTCSTDGSVRLFDGEAKHEVWRVRLDGAAPGLVRPFAKGTRILVASKDGALRVLDATSGATVHESGGHLGAVHEVAFSPDGKRLASGGVDHLVRTWDVVAAKEERVLRGSPADVSTLSWLTDERIVTGGYDGKVRIWRTAGFEERAFFHGDVVGSVIAVDANRVLSTGKGGYVREWDLATGKSADFDERHENSVSATVLTKERAFLATASKDRTIALWNVAKRKRTGVLSGHGGYVNGVAFLPGPQIVSTALDGTARLWDLAKKKQSFTLDLGARGLSLAASPDAKLVFIACDDGTVRVIAPMSLVGDTTLVEVDRISLASAGDRPGWLAVSPDGKRLAVATESGAVLVFALTF